jgi:hypothetical protein
MSELFIRLGRNEKTFRECGHLITNVGVKNYWPEQNTIRVIEASQLELLQRKLDLAIEALDYIGGEIPAKVLKEIKEMK